MSYVMTSILVLCATGFLLSGVAEFVARKADKPFRNRVLNWIELGFLVVPFYIHGFHGNELISLVSIAVFAIISFIKLAVLITRVRKRK